MKKLIVCFLSIIFCYGFTFSSKEGKAETAICTVNTTIAKLEKNLPGIVAVNEPAFHPLIVMKVPFQ